jgi:hypothetical protein
VKRIELKISTDHPWSNDPKTCLLFRYLHHKFDRKRVAASMQAGLPIIVAVSDGLRRNNYDVSEPCKDKKGFGRIWMTCRVEDVDLDLLLRPPSDGDQWRLVTGWGARRKSLRATTAQLERARQVVLEIVEKIVASVNGAKELRRVSFRESETDI